MPTPVKRSDDEDDDGSAPSSSNPLSKLPARGIDDNDDPSEPDEYDDDEYEEIEVEEEVEVEVEEEYEEYEEECEEEGEEGGEEDGGGVEGVLNSPKQATEIGIGVCDTKLSCPSSERFTMLMDKSSTKDGDSKSKSGTYSVNPLEKEILESAINEKDAEILTTRKSYNEHCEPHADSEGHLSNREAGIRVSETMNPSVVIENKVAIPVLSGDRLGDNANAFLHSKEVKSINFCSEDVKEEATSRFPRLVASGIRTQSVSPAAQFRNGNKRPAVICDFYAKGWCIRGSSCRFLHINHEADGKQPLEEAAAAVKLTKESQFDEGLRKTKEEAKFIAFHESMASSLGKDAASSHHSSERILPHEHGQSECLHPLDEKCSFSCPHREDLSWAMPPDPKRSSPFKGVVGSSSSFKDLEIENHRQKWLDTDGRSYVFNGCSSLLFRKSILPERRSFLNNYCSQNRSSYSSSLDFSHIRGMNISSLDSSLSTGSVWPSHRISAEQGLSFPFSSFSNTSNQVSKRSSDHIASGSSSFLRSASPFSVAEPGNFSITSRPGDRLHDAEDKAKKFSNDWEPSVPFRPTFSITSALISSPGSQQYDPFRDSFDIVGDKLFKFSAFGQGTSTMDVSHKPSLLNEAPGAEGNGDKSSVSVSNEIFPKEGSASGTDHHKDIPAAKGISFDHNIRDQTDVPTHKKDLKRERVGQDNDIEVDQKTEGNLQKDSKVHRHFRSALVEFVKKLLKPTWREGHLSKDAHNVIVKKAVDKVLSTLQPHQVPSTMELINQYLSSAQPKIVKLVEGYVTKYGKS